jgi:hypothetical protein
MKRLFFLLVIILMLVVPALAVPATPTVSNIGNNGATFTSSGATGNVTWFRWGVNQQTPEWSTGNISISGGAFSYTVYGSPYYPSFQYYVVACDTTGCSNAATFTSLPTTPLPQTTYSVAFDNITQSNFNIFFIITAIPQPYLWVLPIGTTAYGVALMAGLMIGFYFIGLWLRQRKVTVALLLGIISLILFGSSITGFGWGMPPEFLALAQMICYAALAGVVVSLFKKG